ncbi:hypothetical protein NEOLEDRAFT_1139640 [Neolentinus lepideus HHB14362 ss-1]|uniref:Uncharacterized protein n=1 Tax=Neolentinus lepideus HHB14362 ss-1 TaxID=1314782 RepID=A0A165PP04_9AGAM|nr:hypothetical protein NEOLEDRAFT_1139640 [Neolentinus lepideus HHB14362 ss-1]
MNSLLFIACLVLFYGLASSSPYPAVTLGPAVRSVPLFSRTEPYFPSYPPSCPICAANYSQISSCAQAAPVLANFSMIIFNPGAFVDVIKCACTDTFQSVFPQCADCFTQTNQTDVLNDPDLPSAVSGMRNVCALASTLLGNVSGVDGETAPSSSAAAATATASSSTSLSVSLHNGNVLLVALGLMGLVFMA